MSETALYFINWGWCESLYRSPSFINVYGVNLQTAIKYLRWVDSI